MAAESTLIYPKARPPAPASLRQSSASVRPEGDCIQLYECPLVPHLFTDACPKKLFKHMQHRSRGVICVGT